MPVSYMTFKDMILYSHDTLTIDEVYGAFLSKEKMLWMADQNPEIETNL